MVHFSNIGDICVRLYVEGWEYGCVSVKVMIQQITQGTKGVVSHTKSYAVSCIRVFET